MNQPQPGPNDLPLPTESVPAMRHFAQELSARLGRQLNYAQAYVVLSSAQASGDLEAIGCHDFLKHTTDPRLVDTVAGLLRQHPELLDELQRKSKLQGFE